MGDGFVDQSLATNWVAAFRTCSGADSSCLKRKSSKKRSYLSGKREIMTVFAFFHLPEDLVRWVVDDWVDDWRALVALDTACCSHHSRKILFTTFAGVTASARGGNNSLVAWMIKRGIAFSEIKLTSLRVLRLFNNCDATVKDRLLKRTISFIVEKRPQSSTMVELTNDAALAPLRKVAHHFKNLTQLHLYEQSLSNAQLVSVIHALPSLEALDVGLPYMWSENDLPPASEWDSCDSLHISSLRIVNTSVCRLPFLLYLLHRCPCLSKLVIDIKHCSPLKEAESRSLDEGLMSVLPTLTSLTLHNTRFAVPPPSDDVILAQPQIASPLVYLEITDSELNNSYHIYHALRSLCSQLKHVRLQGDLFQ